MDFEQLTKVRQSCRSYDADRPVEEEKIAKLVEAHLGDSKKSKETTEAKESAEEKKPRKRKGA